MSLISPGVSVTITDDSFYVPSSAPTVPLFFIATADEKSTTPGGSTAAAGTFEHDVIRMVTSISQVTNLYGIPTFWGDADGNQYHGDARNEYGLFAVDKYLEIGNLAYVIRADVNLNDDAAAIRSMWSRKMTEAANLLETLAQTRISDFNTKSGYYVGHPSARSTVSQTELLSDITAALTTDVYPSYSFRGSVVISGNATDSDFKIGFEADHTAAPLEVYSNGFTAAPTGTYVGIQGAIAKWIATGLGSVVTTEWTPAEARAFLLDQAADYQYTRLFAQETSLGDTDAARRQAIVQALISSITSNETIKSDVYEFNLVLCPGYYETNVSLESLARNGFKEECFVIGETPMDKSPEDLVSWAQTYSLHSAHIALYYPHALLSNYDGVTVLATASMMAAQVYAYNDNVAEVWYAPAGTQRGLVSGVTQVGYASGSLGTANTFVYAPLNQGQRDALYGTGTSPTNINMIPDLPGHGILVFGQKTRQGTTTAMDRVNVSRLIKYIKRTLRKSLITYLFQPNDDITRASIKSSVDAFLGTIRTKRGLYDFATVCDKTNNTADRIDNNELYIDIALKPMKAVEFLYVPIRIVATGATI